MRHARADYQRRIVDIDAKIPADEPVMLFRAQDRHFVGVLHDYAERLHRDPQVSPEMEEMVIAHAELARKWPVRKSPDINPDVPREIRMRPGESTIVPGVLPSEAVYGFAAWLTTRAQVVEIGSAHECSIVAELVNDYCKAQGFEPPREGVYPENLKGVGNAGEVEKHVGGRLNGPKDAPGT